MNRLGSSAHVLLFKLSNSFADCRFNFPWVFMATSDGLCIDNLSLDYRTIHYCLAETVFGIAALLSCCSSFGGIPIALRCRSPILTETLED